MKNFIRTREDYIDYMNIYAYAKSDKKTTCNQLKIIFDIVLCIGNELEKLRTITYPTTKT